MRFSRTSSREPPAVAPQRHIGEGPGLLKGRWSEDRRNYDHKLTDDAMMVDALVEGEIGELEVSALTGLNTDLRRQYINDCRGPAVAASRRPGS